MSGPTDDRWQLQSRRSRSMDETVDRERRVLWRAFQHGTLNEEEFVSTLDRLESDTVLQSHLSRDRP